METAWLASAPEGMRSGRTSRSSRKAPWDCCAWYDQALGESFGVKDMEKSQYIPEIMENPRLYGHYPQAVNALMEDIFTVREEPGKKLSSKVTSAVRRDFLSMRTVMEMFGMRRV